jgi:alkylation response protein AidB-like acyl-CoA dehydrogenase
MTDTRVRSPLDAARQLAPSIRAYADEIEETRELPRPLFEELADAGLFHLLVPRSLGGGQLDLPTYIRVIEEIGKADASTAWCINQGGVFATHAACLPPDVARLIWIDTPRAVVANTAEPSARAVPVDGGYRVSGRMGFSTGCRHACWLAARGRILEEGQTEICFFLVPVGEAEILDTWHRDPPFRPDRRLRPQGAHLRRRGSHPG